MRLDEFAPEGVEAGAGLALEDELGRYLFFLAGAKHVSLPGAVFYAGIGGHREPGEDLIACAHREAAEEIGAAVELTSAPVTWYVSRSGEMTQVGLAESPAPLALYEMIHPPGTPREGQVYKLVIYRARLVGTPKEFPPAEVGGLIALPPGLVACSPGERRSLASLLAQGAELLDTTREIPGETLIYPIGTAAVLATLSARSPSAPPRP